MSGQGAARAARRPDDELRRAVLDELRWDTRVDADGLGVEARDGVVTLAGVVGSWGKRVAAEAAARRVAGVREVVSAVAVEAPAPPSDDELARAVRHALRWDVLVPDAQVRAEVAAGVVTLEGDVDTLAQREDAARAIRNFAGVRGVVNRLVVAPGAPTPAVLRAAIHDALVRAAEQDATRILIDVEGGRVTLHGRVRSWVERDAVMAAVARSAGVARVVDRLRIA